MSGSNGRDDALKLWVVLARAHAAVTAHAVADIRRHDLTLAEFGVLELLYHRGDSLIGEIQRRILVSSGGITYLVDRLEQRGLVERRRCKEDRRASYVALRSAGRELIDRIFPDHAAAIERAVGGLDEEERRLAIDLLRKLGLHAASDASR